MCLFLLLAYCSAAVSCIVFAAVVCHFFAVGFSKWYAIVLSMIVKWPPLKSCLLLVCCFWDPPQESLVCKRFGFLATAAISPRTFWYLLLCSQCCCDLLCYNSANSLVWHYLFLLWWHVHSRMQFVMLVLSLLSGFRCIWLFGVFFFPPLVGVLSLVFWSLRVDSFTLSTPFADGAKEGENWERKVSTLNDVKWASLFLGIDLYDLQAFDLEYMFCLTWCVS